MGRHRVCTLLALAACAFAAGCAGSSQPAPRGRQAVEAAAASRAPSAHRRHRHRRRHHRRAGAAAACPPRSRVLDGVYHPDRLQVLDPCRRAAGTVTVVRHEEDGDLHIDVDLDSRYASLLNAENQAQQGGALVVELMARDGGHLPEPSVGDRISLTGAWVDDTQHGWNELHPVWSLRLNGGPLAASGPQFGGSPAADRSSDAAAGCRTASGDPCSGYGPPLSRPHHAAVRRSSGGHGGCDPNYSGACLRPDAADYDCAGGSGNGPLYVRGPVRVVGDDHYGLDSNHDGIACQ